MKATSTKIILDSMRFFAYHGVMPQESVVGNEYVVDMEVDVDYSLAMSTDDLNDTVSYADIYDAVKAQMSVPAKLLEHLAARICGAVFEKCPLVKKIKIRLVKRNPPMGADCDGAGVEVEFVNDNS